MRKIYILFLLFTLSICLYGCSKQNKSVKLIVHVVDQEILEGKTDIHHHFWVYLTNDRNHRIEDFTIEGYNPTQIGKQILTFSYRGYQAKAVIFVVEKNEALAIMEHSDYRLKTTQALSSDASIFQLGNTGQNIVRRNGMIAVYRWECPYPTDATGWEVAINAYGQVENTAVNVEMPKKGMVLSVTGSRVSELQQIQIGDFIIYNGENIIVYRDETIATYNTLYTRFYEVLSEIESTTNLKAYNQKVATLNTLIPGLEQINQTYDDALHNELLQSLTQMLSFQEDIDIYAHQHTYSPVSLTHYDKKEMTLEKGPAEDYLLYTTYSGKLFYGGFRNENTIVHYDASHFETRNQWGYEVAVDSDGYVIDKNNLVDLPDSGFILSGHTAGADFIQENIEIHDRILIQNGKLEIWRNQQYHYLYAYTSLRNSIIDELNTELEHKIPHDYQYINTLLYTIDKLIEETSYDMNYFSALHRFYSNYQLIQDYINIIYSQLIDNQIDQTRGIWYYPFLCFQGVYYYDDTSKEGIVHTLTHFKQMGINEILITPFLEVDNGYMVYESEYYQTYEALQHYNYGEYGHDYLQCFISEAHKLGISVTAYTQTFFAHVPTLKEPNDAYYQMNYQGQRSKSSSYEVYYYDICSPDVQELLVGWYGELLTKYDFDGIEYDIIRYPASNLYRYLNVDVIPSSVTIEDHGYTPYTMNRFMELYSLEGDLRAHIVNSKTVRKNWLDFKMTQLNQFVERLSNFIRLLHPDMKISAAVLSDANYAKQSHLQDYQTWINKGWVDAIEPMVYTSSVSEFTHSVTNIYNQGLDTSIRIGIGAKLTQENTYLDLQEIKLMDDYGGYLLFSSYYYYRDTTLVKLLSHNHHYTYISTRNTQEEIEQAYIEDTLDMIENYYTIVNHITYDYLIRALESHDINRIIAEIKVISDQQMKTYLLQRFNQL